MIFEKQEKKQKEKTEKMEEEQKEAGDKKRKKNGKAPKPSDRETVLMMIGEEKISSLTLQFN